MERMVLGEPPRSGGVERNAPLSMRLLVMDWSSAFTQVEELLEDALSRMAATSRCFLRSIRVRVTSGDDKASSSRLFWVCSREMSS